MQLLATDSTLVPPDMLSANNQSNNHPGLARVMVVGNYLPRRCGIATFTTDLCENLADVGPDLRCDAVAMNDSTQGYSYPARVCFEIDANRREEYDTAADFINLQYPDVVSLQHEFGIFGGNWGRYVIPMLRQLHSPIVTTLHTVFKQPTAAQRQVIHELAGVSDRFVVMSRRAEAFLQEIYEIPAGQITFIHHGIPDVPFVDPNYYKDKFQAEGRRVLLTFGLLRPEKGIEYAIDGLAMVAREFPDVLYIILGATHPVVKRLHGEQYRYDLIQRVNERGLGDNVAFVDRFASLEELKDYLGATDVYITPYLDEEQVTSGTLAYAMGTGKAVVSTPYWYAEEMLAEERGRLVPFRNPEALGEALLDMFRNETARHAMRKRAYQYGRQMAWPAVAREYLRLFEEVRDERARSPKPAQRLTSRQYRFATLPDLNPAHLVTLTDDTGILQHAQFSVPDPRHGYATDDQAHALVVAVRGATARPESADWDALATRYLSFLVYAFNEETSRFDSFMNYERKWTRPEPEEEAHARAVWGLAHAVAFSPHRRHQAMASNLLERAMVPTVDFTSPRAWAYVILAIQTYLRRYSGASSFRREREVLAQRLVDEFERNASENWPWPEDRLTYANARIPHALIEAGQWLQDQKMLDWGFRALEWLDAIQTAETGHFSPIGTNGWCVRGEEKARFDQQPIEAYTMLDACVAAYRTTHDERWLAAGRRAFEWFLGRNDLSLPMHDFVTGACFDGLHADRANQNQGAEATNCWLLSLLLMHEQLEDFEQRAQETKMLSSAASVTD
jgi:glycosyltransferase involved in cell wall biosynthesis